MCLECTYCGRQTRGWLLSPREEVPSPAPIASNRGKFSPRLVKSEGA